MRSRHSWCHIWRITTIDHSKVCFIRSLSWVVCLPQQFTSKNQSCLQDLIRRSEFSRSWFTLWLCLQAFASRVLFQVEEGFRSLTTRLSLTARLWRRPFLIPFWSFVVQVGEDSTPCKSKSHVSDVYSSSFHFGASDSSCWFSVPLQISDHMACDCSSHALYCCNTLKWSFWWVSSTANAQ